MALKNTLRTRENTDIVFLKALLKISYAFSTAPYYDFGKKEVRRFRFYSFYSICTLSLIIGGFLYSAIFIKEDSGSGSQSEQISKFLQMVTALLLAIAASMAASSPLYMSDKWQYLLQQLQNINVKLGYWERESSENTKKIFALLFLVFLPIVCKDIYCFIAYIHNAASVVPKYFICNTIFECYCFVPTVLMVLLGIILKDKYETVLELLKYSKNNCNAGVFTKKSGYINIDELFNDHATYDNYLRRIAKLFRLLNSILENYNLVFGYQMLFMLGYTLLSVLETFDYCLKYKQLSSGDSFNPLLANLCITGFNLVFTQTTLLASSPQCT